MSDLGKSGTAGGSEGPAREELTATFVELAVRLGMLGVLLYWALVLLEPFISIAIWSVVIAVALYPAFDWTAARLGGRRRLAALLITGIFLLVIIGPMTWLVLGLVESIRLVSDRLDLSTLALPSPWPSVKSWPLIGEKLYNFWALASTNLKAALATIAPELKPLGSSLLSIAAGTGTGILKFFASILVAGFLFVPAPHLVDGLKQFARRLVLKRGDAFVDLAGATIRMVARGVVGISALQALLAGLGLLIAGVPGTSLITSAVLILGIVQIGPSIVLIPVVIWSWFTMETMPALLFTAYMVPVNLIDNILRPIVFGRGVRVPMLIILIGVVGGTLAYGITGLFLGPILLAVIWELVVAWVADAEPAHIDHRPG